RPNDWLFNFLPLSAVNVLFPTEFFRLPMVLSAVSFGNTGERQGAARFRTEGGSPAWTARSQTISGAHMESMPKQDLLTRLQLDLRRHGRRRTAYVLAMKLINKLFLFRILHNLHPQKINPTYLRSEEHTSELQSREKLVCRLL